MHRHPPMLEHVLELLCSVRSQISLTLVSAASRQRLWQLRREPLYCCNTRDETDCSASGDPKVPEELVAGHATSVRLTVPIYRSIHPKRSRLARCRTPPLPAPPDT